MILVFKIKGQERARILTGVRDIGVIQDRFFWFRHGQRLGMSLGIDFLEKRFVHVTCFGKHMERFGLKGPASHLWVVKDHKFTASDDANMHNNPEIARKQI